VAELDALFATGTLAEWRERLAKLEGPWEPMQTAAELHDDPQTIANGYLRLVDGGDKGRFALVADPVQFDETPLELAPAPELGQHTEEVLLELGLSWDEIATHKQAGAIN
jgi:crotonobetainyl-CoA:carnitine CoA-transferase CaiB-like acyl-CoA transferase